MIFYKEEKKKLVIPSGFVMIPIECDEAIEQAREQGYQEGFADGSSATCDTEEGTYSLTDDFDGEETVFPSEGKTGFNKIAIVDDGYGDKKYDEGYADGQADCPECDCSSAVTEAYQSGYTEGYNQGQADCPECSGSSCNLQSKSVVVSANTQTVSPDQGYDGMNSVSIDATSFGNGRYQQGYEAGYDSGYEDAEEEYPRIQPQKNYTADTTSFVIVPNNGYDGMGKVNVNATPVFNQGYQSGLTACSGETPCDCSSAITEAYESGVTEGIAQQKSLLGSVTFTHNNTFTNHSGWSSVTVNVPKEVVLGELVATPLSNQLQNDKYYIQEFKSGLTVDGWGRVQIDMTQMLHYGRKKQRDLFSAATFTENGVYTRENGWSAVTVDVPQCDCSSAITEAYQSGYTAGQAACSAATEEAYESGVTEGQGSIFSVKVRWLSPVTSWNLDNEYYPDLFIVDESGTSHQLNYVYQQSPTLVRYNTGMEDDTPQGWIMFAEFAGYLQDGAKYIQPYQVKFPMLNNNLWNNNIEGLSVEVNGEVIHNWRQDDSGLDDWQFGSGAWRFTPLATVVSDTYYDATHKMVTFYIQGQVPNNN